MDIHKPKAIHNWREFLKEYAIIVLGVATALAGEQSVEWFHWRDQVAEARRAIATETATNIGIGIVRMRFATCMEKRLDTLGQILDAASRSGNLPPVGNLGETPNGIMLSGEWDSLMASQTAAHVPHDELAGLNFMYISVVRANARSLQEVEAIAQISAMVGPGRRLDPESEGRLRDALSRERLYNRGLAQAGIRIWKRAAQQNMAFSPADIRIIERRQHSSIPCPPLDKPMASNYGQGPWGFVLPETEDTLKHPPRLHVVN